MPSTEMDGGGPGGSVNRMRSNIRSGCDSVTLIPHASHAILRIPFFQEKYLTLWLSISLSGALRSTLKETIEE